MNTDTGLVSKREMVGHKRVHKRRGYYKSIYGMQGVSESEVYNFEDK